MSEKTAQEIFTENMNALADAINAKAGTTGKKTIVDMKMTIDSIPTPSGNQDISTLDEYDVSTKATARISAAERAKIIPENIADGVTLLGVTGTHQGGGGTAYSITANVTNGTASGATVTYPDGTGTETTAEVTITPSANYALPSSVTVSGATSNYNSTTGVITLTNATGDITITAACLAVYSVTKTITNGSATGASTITQGQTATVTIVPDAGYDAPTTITVVGASYTYDSTSGVVSLSNPTGNVVITGECASATIYKGKIINIDMDGDGTPEQYRIIKLLNGDIVEVVAIGNIGSSTFGSTNTYENSNVDTFINTTWYGSLSNAAKTALVDKTFRQDEWAQDQTGNPVYEAKHNAAYNLSLSNNSFGNEITRHIYLLSIQDVIDYLEATPSMTSADTTITTPNVLTMFWNSTQIGSEFSILRSASATYQGRACDVRQNSGTLMASTTYTSFVIKPAFQIDLSKISYS